MFKKKFRVIALMLCIVLMMGFFVVNTEAVSTVLLAVQGAIVDGNLVKFSGINGIGVDAGVSAINVVKCKFDATSAPTDNDDVDEGYTVGSRWLDVTNDKSYVCLDNTDGAAVWHLDVVGPGSSTDHAIVRWDSTTGRTTLDSVVTISDAGVIAGGEWQGTVISPVYGGTGIANNVASTWTISGNFATTITVTNVTGVTLPTAGTLCVTTGTPETTFQIDDDNSGPKLRNSAGEMQIRNAANDDYANLRALSFYGDGSNLTGVGAASATALTIEAKAAENIDKGEAVYISGATGQTPEVSLADNTDVAKCMIVGIAAETKTTGQTILIRVRGELTSLVTNGFVDGDVLYLSTAGAITKTEPTSGHIIIIGYCSYSHVSAGKIVILSHPTHGVSVPAATDIVIRMGDALGANKVIFKDYANAEVAYIDSDGGADFNSLILDTVLAIAEGGTNSGTALNNDRVMVSSAGAIIESATITTTELARLNGLAGIIVTDNNACTDLEGTKLSIGAGVLNCTETDSVVGAVTGIVLSDGGGNISASAVADTFVLYIDGATNIPSGEAGFTYIKGTDTLNVVNIVCTAISGTLTGTASVAASGDAAVDFFGAGVDAVTDTTTCTDIEGTLLSITGVTLNVTIPEDHINATMLKDDNAPADEDFFCYELTGTTGHWYSRAELTIASSGANVDITSILNAALYVGRDADNNVSWAVDDTLGIKIGGVLISIVDIETGVGDNDSLVTQGYVDDIVAGANVNLSNLAAVAINTSLISDAVDTDDLGSALKEWRSIYVGTVGKIYLGLSQEISLEVTDANTLYITASVNVSLSGGLIVAGTVALAANNITMTGSIGVTGSRVTKVWTEDLESTNDITIGGTALAAIYSPIAGSASIVTVGTIGTGAWEGTDVGLAHGGTGVSTGAMVNFTSILNTALYVGRDADNQIKFASDNTIVFRLSGVDGASFISTGELDMGAHSAGFTMQTATGDGTTTIDWRLGNYFLFTHGDMAETFAFTAPTNPGSYTLEVLEDANGSHDCTWPAAVTWLGAEPTWTDGGANKTIVVVFIYDGTTYWSQGTPWEE